NRQDCSWFKGCLENQFAGGSASGGCSGGGFSVLGVVGFVRSTHAVACLRQDPPRCCLPLSGPPTLLLGFIRTTHTLAWLRQDHPRSCLASAGPPTLLLGFVRTTHAVAG